MLCEYHRFIITGILLIVSSCILGKLLFMVPKHPKLGFKMVRKTEWGYDGSISYMVMNRPIWQSAVSFILAFAFFIGVIILLSGSQNKKDLSYNCRPSSFFTSIEFFSNRRLA